jgi:hypothetical protein
VAEKEKDSCKYCFEKITPIQKKEQEQKTITAIVPSSEKKADEDDESDDDDIDQINNKFMQYLRDTEPEYPEDDGDDYYDEHYGSNFDGGYDSY